MEPRPFVTASYRLQLHQHFRFQDVAKIVDYLSLLGISHLYLSPILTSRPGSTHGYDGIDPTNISWERGSEREFKKLLAHMQQHAPQMRVILDIVPNHMAASFDNLIWRDALTFGMKSTYWKFFDLRLQTSTHRRAIVLPVLGDNLPAVLSRDEIRLEYQLNDGFYFRYYEHRFPIALSSYPDILLQFLAEPDFSRYFVAHEQKELERVISTMQRAVMDRRIEGAPLLAAVANWFSVSTARLHALREFIKKAKSAFIDAILRGQHYQLENWRMSSRVNYRRFFDINDLIATHVEERWVFDALHQKIMRLFQNNPELSGLRIDHIDGLYAPQEYLTQVNDICSEIWVEKILAPREQLKPTWPILGTTGYEFIQSVSQLFVSPSGFSELKEFHHKLNRRWRNWQDNVDESKMEILSNHFEGDLNYFAKELLAIAKSKQENFTLNDIRSVIGFLSASLSIYRTYFDEKSGYDGSDAKTLEAALRKTRQRIPESLVSTLDWLKTLLLDEPNKSQPVRHFILQWQQFTGVAAAKGIEDTMFYRYVPLVSLNEVGGKPELSGDPQFQFHLANKRRQKSHPCSLNASSTHDTKRSEDTRARIHVLSEMANEFVKQFQLWSSLNDIHKTTLGSHIRVPELATEYFIYQNLLGVWPNSDIVDAEFVQRIRDYAVKAARESKGLTSWIAPNADYEKALLAFISAILDKRKAGPFLRRFRAFAHQIAFYGALNSLSMLALKILTPGVPDFYQGCETWNHFLVDPDNRQAVDYESHRQIMSDVEQKAKMGHSALYRWLINDWRSGAIKIWLTHALLTLRTQHAQLFRDGQYLPLEVKGVRREHIIAFAREWQSEWLVVVVPRFFAKTKIRKELTITSEFWHGTYVVLPEDAPKRWQNCFSGKISLPRRGQISADTILQGHPVVLRNVG